MNRQLNIEVVKPMWWASLRSPLPRHPGRLKTLSQSIMIGLLSVSLLLPYAEVQARSADGDLSVASDVSNSTILSSSMSLQSPVKAQVMLPNSEYTESHMDLRVKTLGGEIKLERTWLNGRWYLNTTWANLRFIADPLDGSVKTIDRAGTLLERSDGTNQYTSGNIAIDKTDNGWRWHNRDGDWISYDPDGRMTGYGDRNGITVTIVLDAQGRRSAVQDHHGETIYTFAYNQDDLLSRVTDKSGRSVSYTWQGQRLVGVTDVMGKLWQYQYNSDGQITQRAEPDGGKVTIGYSYSMPAGKPTLYSGANAGVIEESSVVTSGRAASDSKVARVSSITDKAGAVTLYQSDYDRQKQHYTITVEDPLGKQTVKTFDAQGRLLTVLINGVLQTRIERDGDREIRTTDVRGLTTTVRYDLDKRPIQVIYPDGTSAQFEYNNLVNALARQIDASGIVTAWEYDNRGNVVRQVEAQGLPEERVTLYDYDNWGQLLGVRTNTDSAAVTVAFDYDAAGNISAFTDGEGHTTRYQHTVDGQVNSLILPSGKVWRYGYDTAGHLISETDPLEQESHYTYNPVGQLMKVMKPTGNTTHYVQELSKERRVFKAVNPLGEAHQVVYDATDNLLEVISHAGLRQSLHYDANGRLVQIEDAAGNVTSLEYGGAGTPQADRVTSILYPTFKEAYTYDRMGMTTSVSQLLDTEHISTTQTSYNAQGLAVSITRPGALISLYEYDAFGNQLTEIDASGASTHQQVDSWGRVQQVRDANNNLHRYTYDKNDNRVAETLPTGERNRSVYNEDGLLTQRIDAAGNTTDYQYDDTERLVLKSVTAAGEPVPQQTVTYSYEETGNWAMAQHGSSNNNFRYSVDALGRTTGETITYGSGDKAFTVTLGYHYDEDGKLTGMIYPDGSHVVFNWEKGLLKQSRLPNGESIDWQDYNWLQPGNIRFPGVEQTITYDVLLRPLQMQVKADDELLLARSYRYDEANRIEVIGDKFGEFNYRYDRADRLTQALPSQALQDQGLPLESYAYDAVGNRIGSLHQPGEWRYGGDNRLLQWGEGDALIRFDYTANGHIATETSVTGVRRFEYDATDRLVQVETNGEETARYSYDPQGRRISKTVNGETTWYLYSLEGLIAELDAQGAMKVAYGWEPDTPFGTAPLWQANIASGQTLIQAEYHFLFRDHLGTPQIAVNNQGEITWKGNSEAFGKTKADIDNQIVMNLRFPGQYYDNETGTHYNYFRDYDPTSGRYRQRDPIGLEGGSNGYAFTENNPLNFIDPMGLKMGVGTGAVPGLILPGIPNPSAEAQADLALRLTRSLNKLKYNYMMNTLVMAAAMSCLSNNSQQDKTKECPPCNPPAGVKFNVDTHYEAHEGRGLDDGTHGCLASTGSPIHWHYDVYNQNPNNCECHIRRHIFGGCGIAP